MAIPIWKDTIISYLSLGETQECQISVDGNIIYNGRLYKYPGNPNITAFINTIASNYLSSKIELDRSKTEYTHNNYMRTFAISPAPLGDAQVSLYNDWSYEEGRVYDGTPQILSSPLSTIVDPRQLFFVTLSPFGVNCLIHISGRNGEGRQIHGVGDKTDMCKTHVINLRDYPAMADIEVAIDYGEFIKYTQYTVQPTCAKYCLYYLNAYGGYDHLLVKGNSMRTDSFSRTEVAHDVRNTALQHGREIVREQIQRTWKLHTDCLTDDQWAKTHHLLGSPLVYLHDLETDEITPVVIKNNVAEFRTYRNQRNKMSNLTIEVEAASKRMRK